MTSAVVTAIANIQAKHNSEIFSLQEMIKKFLLLRESPPDPNATPKAYSGADSLPKTTTER